MKQPRAMLTAIQAWHSSYTSQEWLSTLKSSKAVVVLTVLLTLAAVIANSSVRTNQWDAWKAQFPAETFSGTFFFSTADAPYFLAQASAIRNGETRFEFNEHRLYPNLVLEDDFKIGTPTIFEWPLLSVVIAGMADSNSSADLIKAGNSLVIVSSILTALMIICCFGAAGYWLEGAVASIGGGLSFAYLSRSSIGRIDTDQLNLGFVYLIFGLIIFAARAQSRRVSLGICVAIGLICNLFMWWWNKPTLMFIFACALFWSFAALRRDFKLAFITPPLVLFLSGMRQVNPFSSLHFKEAIEVTTNTAQEISTFSFPNSLKTVTENQQLPLHEIFTHATGSLELGILSLLGLAIFLFRHPFMAIAFGPLVSFGLLNFVIGNRAVFFSVPMMWFGIAFLISTTARFVTDRCVVSGSSKEQTKITAVALGSCLAAAIAWANSPVNYTPRPSFPIPVVSAFEKLQQDDASRDAIVATWWDYGYTSSFLNSLPTLHDGGNQTSPTTHFTAQALLNGSQQSSLGTLKFLTIEGHKGLKGKTTKSDLDHAFNEAEAVVSPDIFLAVTGQMARWIGSISKIGNWDIEAGKPIELPGLEPGEQLQYYPMSCRMNRFPQQLACQGVTFDLQRGLMNGRPGLMGWTQSRDGQIVRQKSFDNGGHFAVQLVQTGARLTAYLMHRQLYESTFNELYHLGQIDDPSITLHYDDYPHIRIYKISGDGS